MSFPSLWPRRRPRVALAFSDRFLLAVRAGEPGDVLRATLPDGGLTPAPIVPNIPVVREVGKLAAAMIADIGARHQAVSVLLPDLSITTMLLAPGELHGQEVEGALGARLGYPVSEARSDTWKGRKGEILAAAIRNAVVRQYEQVIEASDSRLGWVDGASLARIPLWADRATSDEGVTVYTQLYASHYFLAVFRSGELVDVRTRLRSAGDAESVAEELKRLPALYDTPSIGRLVLSGDGAALCATRLAEVPSVSQVSVSEDGEESQLAACLRALLQRS